MAAVIMCNILYMMCTVHVTCVIWTCIDFTHTHTHARTRTHIRGVGGRWGVAPVKKIMEVCVCVLCVSSIAKWLENQPGNQKVPGSMLGYAKLVLLFP